MKFHTLGLVSLLSLGALPTAALAVEKAVVQAPVGAAEQVQFDVYVPLQQRAQLEKDLAAMHTPGDAMYRKWLTPQQFDARYAATPAQTQAIVQQLTAAGLQATVIAGHRIHVSGTSASIEKAFATTLYHAAYQDGHQTIMTLNPVPTTGAMYATGALVTGFSGTIRLHGFARKNAMPANRYSTAGPYWFDDLKQAYSYPSYQSYNGAGTTIGVLISNDFKQSDMNLYFGHEKLTSPSFTTINVDGGAPFDPNASLETSLDLQQTGGMAPKAKVLLYNLPDLSDDSIMDGLSKILMDNKADVVNMSFGEAELFYTAADNGGQDFTYLAKEEDDLFAQGTAQGITFVAASGDSGALAAVPVKVLQLRTELRQVPAFSELPRLQPARGRSRRNQPQDDLLPVQPGVLLSQRRSLRRSPRRRHLLRDIGNRRLLGFRRRNQHHLRQTALPGGDRYRQRHLPYGSGPLPPHGRMPRWRARNL